MPQARYALQAALAALVLAAQLALAPTNALAQPGNVSQPETATASYTTFSQAEFLQTKSLTPPPANAEWAVVDLPDSWRRNNRPRDKYGWYRIRFEHRAQAQGTGTQVAGAARENTQHAIYISRITNNIEMFLNGSAFAVSGRFEPNAEESWNLAQFHFVPTSLLRKGENELLIRLHPERYTRAGIAEVIFGDATTLRGFYNQRHFIQTLAPQLITGVLVVMAVFSLTIWLRRRNETMFLLFGLMSAVAVVRLFHHYLRDTPLWLALAAAPAMCWLTALQVNFVLHYARRPMPRTERALIIFATSATAALYFAALVGWYYTVVGIVYAILGILAPILGAILIYQLSRKPGRGNILMIVASLLTTVFGVHDFLNYQEVLGFDQLYLIPLGLPLLLVAVAALLLRRFVETLRDHETLNAQLAHRIHEREQDLAAAYARERELDQRRTSSDERQRLMRDMHDGLGSHLMSTLALMKRGNLEQREIETILADCIDELKLTIDSLEPVERDLLVVLGNLRYRLEPRLNAAGISLEWAVTDLPPLSYLDPENVRSVLRIVQEAFTNTLKHANARRITLSTGIDRAANRVWVRVTDDGHSFDLEKARRGRGLENMKGRATRLGGSAEILPLKGGGTCVNLYLPMQ